jgi:hypothetical protein
MAKVNNRCDFTSVVKQSCDILRYMIDLPERNSRNYFYHARTLDGIGIFSNIEE